MEPSSYSYLVKYSSVFLFIYTTTILLLNLTSCMILSFEMLFALCVMIMEDMLVSSTMPFSYCRGGGAQIECPI